MITGSLYRLWEPCFFLSFSYSFPFLRASLARPALNVMRFYLILTETTEMISLETGCVFSQLSQGASSEVHRDGYPFIFIYLPDMFV